MKCDCDDIQEASISSTNVVFEASTQTPTTETCDSPLFSQQRYCLKTDGHSYNALNNIHKMQQHGQVKTKTNEKQKKQTQSACVRLFVYLLLTIDSWETNELRHLVSTVIGQNLLPHLGDSVDPLTETVPIGK